MKNKNKCREVTTMISKALLVFLLMYSLSGFSYGQKDEKFFRADYTYIETSQAFYKMHMTRKNVTEAIRVCELEGASLFYPENDAEARAVISYWHEIEPTGPWVYVGITALATKGVFKTIDNRPISEVYHNWHAGEPNDWHGLEDCVYMTKVGTYYDCQCWPPDKFICKKSVQTPECNDNCNKSDLDGQKDEKFFRADYTYIETSQAFYKMHMTRKNVTEAIRVCELEGASLFYPENDAEAQAVIAYWHEIEPTGPWVYVGITALATKGVFKTIDNRPISEVYHNWHAGEPNDWHGLEDCVYMTQAGTYYDCQCWPPDKFICKKSHQTLECDDNCNKSDLDGRKDKNFFRADYTYVETSQAFYKMHMTRKNVTEAIRVCELEGASLFYPENDAEAQAVIAYWNEIEPTGPWVYVGITALATKGIFKTIDNRPISEVYHNWHAGEPNDWHGLEDCVYMTKAGTYYDCQCWPPDKFICKKSLQTLVWDHNCNMSDLGYTYNEELGKCYKFHTTPLNWTDAYAVCSAEQSHLAVITNLAEANYLANLTESTPRQKVKGNYLRGIYHLGFHNRCNNGWQTVKNASLSVINPVFRNGYTYMEAFQAFYKMHTERKSVADAIKECELEGASLFYPENDAEARAVIAYWQEIEPTGPWVYVGITALETKGVFKTIDNRSVSEVYHNWQAGEPNDWHGLEDCVFMTKAGTYYDCQCWPPDKFICKKKLQNLERDEICNSSDLGTPLNDTEAWWGNYLPEADDSNQCGSMFFNGLLTYVGCDMRSLFICEHEGRSESLSEMV